METDTTSKDADVESTAIPVSHVHFGTQAGDSEAVDMEAVDSEAIDMEALASPPNGTAARRSSWIQRRVSLLRQHYSRASHSDDSLRGETMNAVLGDMANTMAANEDLVLQNSKLSVKVSLVNTYDN